MTLLSEPITIPITDWLDLHSFSPRDMGELIPEYLELCQAQGYKVIRLIHGKGTGVLKARVRAILQHHPLVAGFADAEPEAGGWGATRVLIKGKD
jgi:DNA-nicking Smr family endonuclease